MRRLLVLLALAGSALVGGVSSAQAVLVPGELRLGPDSSAPAVPLFDPASPTETSLGLRELPGGAPTVEFAGTEGSFVLTCQPFPADQILSAPGLESNGPVTGRELYLRSQECDSPYVAAEDIELELYGDPLGAFAMRAETDRPRGGRDGVLEPRPNSPFRLRVDFFENDGDHNRDGGCLYSLFAPGAPTRIDVYNPGHGHKISFHNEPLRLVSGDSICSAANFVFDATVRLRGHDTEATGPVPWTKPVWLLPAAAPG
jgi:hypothetical protein